MSMTNEYCEKTSLFLELFDDRLYVQSLEFYIESYYVLGRIYFS